MANNKCRKGIPNGFAMKNMVFAFQPSRAWASDSELENPY